jgi:chorismate mutase
MGERRLRGIRGATTVGQNTAAAILGATRCLLLAMQEANGFAVEDVVTVFFTLTPDLDAAFPAAAAREMGWTDVPLFGAQEAAVPGSPERCVRVLIQLYTEREARDIHHVYMGEAARLRPDRT